MPTEPVKVSGGGAPRDGELNADERDDSGMKALTRRMREFDKWRLAKWDQDENVLTDHGGTPGRGMATGRRFE